MGLCPECLVKAGCAPGTQTSAKLSGAARRFIPPALDEMARLFPQFEMLNLIGQGGMGAVYKARQPALDRFVALKVLPVAAAGDPGFAERFNREARALARLNHPNIVAVHDFGKAGDLHYLVMEYVDGTNLREVEQTGKLTPEQALAIVPQICEGLQFAHNEGVVHRDIKPENLLLDKKGRVKITDFGIAKMVGPEASQTLTGTQDVMGTPHYMAPEQLEHPLAVDHRADIFSLGVVFYEMLTGELPLGKFAAPSERVKIDVRLDEVVLHALEKEPERRYQRASQVKTAVETIAATPGEATGRKEVKAPLTGAQLKAARDCLITPARGLLVAASIQLLFSFGLILVAPGAAARDSDNLLLGFLVLGLIIAFFAVPGALVMIGAVNMLKLRRHTLAVVSSVVAALGPGAIVGLPCGIWALVKLFRPEVREAFDAELPPNEWKTEPDAGKLNSARNEVHGPAIGLIGTGVLDWFLMSAACFYLCYTSKAGTYIWLPFLAIALSTWIIYAGFKLKHLEQRGLVMTGCVLAMLVAPGNLIGLPVGIWALVTMNRADVRKVFQSTGPRLPA